jgi:menaquinone-dependent protoporphyrinogen oxidase
VTATKVLVAYASKYGATAEIAEKIGEVLRQSGLEADVLRADRVPDLAVYAAVVLGSAVYAGMWRKEAVQLLEGNQIALAGRPVWLFSSGPTGKGDPVQLLGGWRFPTAQQAIADRIQPRDLAVFHGKIDMERLSLAEKLMVKAVKGQAGDSREWDAIAAWAADIARTLSGPGG